MKIKLKKSDIYLLVLFYCIAIPLSIFGYSNEEPMFERILAASIYFVFSFIALYVIVFILFPMFFPNKRIVLLFIAILIFMIALGSLEIWTYRWAYNEDGKIHSLLPFIVSALDSTLQNAGILIGIFLGKKFYDVQLDLQKKEKEKKESELRLLKSQIDPHFLFNNLNTIDALIDNKPVVAKKYIHKLSRLYRYLIHTKEDEVVPMEDELEFVNDYIYLMNQRYGNAYEFETKINTALDCLFIPPGALQTLLENVVKHNHGDITNPIKTIIEINDRETLVSNNLQLKSSKRESFGIGLNNLTARYALLSDQKIVISSDTNFHVTLPHLKQID